ncbi:MAG TPA: hypothetical protein VGM16_00575 [Gammaproteobacteria bacterium]|jgi:hypothetical protein
MGIRRILIMSFLAALLAACGLNPVDPETEDKLPMLTGDQGIAGVSFQALFPITDIELKPVSGAGALLHVAEVPVGDSVYLFVTPAGKYCIEHYRFKNRDYDVGHLGQCFDVEAGKLSYSGTFTPTMPVLDQLTGGNNGGMEQHDNPGSFALALKQQYPRIAAAAYAAGSDQSVGDLVPAPKPVDYGGVCDLMTGEQASALLGEEVKPGAASRLGNLITCNYLKSDDESVHVIFQVCSDPVADLDDMIGKETLMTGGVMQPIQGFPGKAGTANKKHNYELDVALPDRLMMLVVDGTGRDDVQSAMIAAMQRMLPNVKTLAPDQPCA